MELSNEIMFRYRERRKRDLDECKAFLEHEKFNDIEKVGHQLKGNGATFGYPELSLLGKNLEVAARSHNHEALQKILKALSEWVDDLH